MTTQPLSNTRHEKFCMAVAQGETQKSAYLQAGFSQTNAMQNASILAARPEISARIAELKTKYLARLEQKFDAETDHRSEMEREIAETGTVSRESLLLALIDNARKATKLQQFGAATAALKLLGQANGMWLDNSGKSSSSADTVKINLDTPRFDIGKVSSMLESLGFTGEPAPRPLPAITTYGDE